MKGYVILISIVAALGGLLFGFDTAVISGTINFIQPYFGLSEAGVGWTVSSLLFGCIAGVLIAGKAGDQYGRKKMLMLAALLFFLSAIGSASAHSLSVFVTARVLGGIAVGIASILSPMYIAELAPAKYRGTLVSLNQLAIVIGILVAFFSNWLLVDSGINNWRWMLLVMAAPAVLLFFSLFLVPESPRWLVARKQYDKALKVLLKTSGKDATKELSEIRQTLKNQEESVFSDLMAPNIRPLLFIGIILAVFQQITGINTIMYYAPKIFANVGQSNDSALLQTIAIGGTNLIFTLVAMVLIDRFGRRPLIMIGSTGMFLMLTGLSVLYFTNQTSGVMILVFILGYIAFFAASLGPALWVVAAELFPNRLRSKGMSVAIVSLWIACAIVSISFPIMLEKLSGGITFMVFALICLANMIYVWRYVPETKGKTLEELEKHFSMKNLLLLLTLTLVFFGCRESVNQRQVISLNGTWEIAKTDTITELPTAFTAKAPVPGLVDMTVPAIDTQDTAYDNSIYWYRRTFTVEQLDADVIQLKINKAKYHTRVYVNGKLAGENSYSFTPSVFDVKTFLNNDGKENELVISVGCRNNLPDTVTHGGDFEKTKYIPGIYDDVKLTLASYPFISNVQVVPDIENRQLRVVAELMTGNTDRNRNISYVVREAVSKKVITQGDIEQNKKNDDELQLADFIIKMDSCQLWTPENPFLYDLELTTSGDNTSNRFGMRTFAASKDSSVFLLNGKPYYMRGTNVCIFRFFEDPDRAGLPWDSKWTAKLHDRFKEMHWNSIRYCIGFPPERWYEIADSVGFLIQDEYPVWTGGKGGFEKLLKGITSRQLAAEYSLWMRERWNHPCVVVWDAQNESVNDTTAKAIQIARTADLSNRPWDNGWAAPASDQDAIESHPYLFSRYMKQLPGKEGYLKELFQQPHAPRNDPNAHSPAPDGSIYTNPVILNEYGWIWLNRNGSTTTLTDQVYANVFPEADTPAKRLEVYAKNLAILTEYWRAHRKAGAVLHFCGLGYSRPEKPRGQTSDNFTDINNLTYEPHFYKYMKAAFSPVGIMLEFWEKNLKYGEKISVPVHLINDTYENVTDSVSLTILSGDKVIFSQSAAYQLGSLEKKIIQIPVTVPTTKSGQCVLEAEIHFKGETVKSIREFSIN